MHPRAITHTTLLLFKYIPQGSRNKTRDQPATTAHQLYKGCNLVLTKSLTEKKATKQQQGAGLPSAAEAWQQARAPHYGEETRRTDHTELQIPGVGKRAFSQTSSRDPSVVIKNKTTKTKPLLL